MDKRKIYFRADADANIGYGHFVRTLALADMLKDDFDCTFYIVSPSDFMVKELENVCSYVVLEEETKFQDFVASLSGKETVVLDNYFFTPDYQLEIKNKGCRLVCVDDMHDRHYYADIVINHATGLKRDDFDLEPYTQLCTGLNWSLLRKEFLNSTSRISEHNKDIFICFGGSDFCNITTKVLEAISLDNYDCTIHVVLGDANTQRQGLIEKYNGTNVKFYSSLTAQQMIDVMNICKIGILPASGLLWESLYVGLPSIYGYYVDNQIDICMHNSIVGNSVCIGDYRTISIENLASSIHELYCKHLNMDIIYNRNIKSNYLNLFNCSLTCRRALKEDCDLYFAWANDPVTRSMAFNKEQIPYENHCKWYNKKIIDSNSILYLFYSDKIPVGQVRFDIVDGTAEIDISIDKDCRGQKYGSKMLSQALFLLKIDRPKVIPVSEVLVGNYASQRIFEKCGFVKVAENESYNKYEFYYSI